MRCTAQVVAMISILFGLWALPMMAAEGEGSMRPEVRVGISEGDLCGSDHRVLQAAVDYIAGLGGGVVHIGPGEWVLRDSVRLRSGVSLIGSGADTVLRKAPGGSSRLAEDGDYGDVRVLPEDPSGFEVGDGVTVRSDRQAGFHSTVATIIRKDPDGGLTLDGILNSDFMVAHEATVSRACPLIRAVDQHGLVVRDLVLDGDRENCPPEDGCRGGALNLLRVANVKIANVTFCNMNGDGLSFQNSPDVVVEDCVFEDNVGGGCHPGSGSARPVVRRCVMRRNGGCGIFVCWRVKDGRLEDNVIEDNGQMGISIGHKDTDNLFLRNQIRRNALSGIYFRDEAEHAGGHRCVIQDCVIEDNGSGGSHGDQPAAGIRIDGETNNVVIRGNTIRDTRGEEATQTIAVLINSKAGEVTIEGDVAGEVRDLREE